MTIPSSAHQFVLHQQDGSARLGEIQLSRGVIRTPAFMPVGTQATVKAMLVDHVRDTGADIILGNTYHLMLRPGAERVAKLGGLHCFMNWPAPILTDSGGFQVMSLAGLRKLSDDGVLFRSHIDGSEHFLSPERSIEIQGLLGADIQMVLDECTPYPATEDQAKKSLDLSMSWAERSKTAFGAQPDHMLFGIVQGSVFDKLREQSAHGLVDIGFDGYAVGGLAVGEGQEEMLRVLDITCPLLPQQKPRYLMGVGKPLDIVHAVARGIDMFDCVLPTRSGRHGQAFTWDGPINLRNARFAEDLSPLDPNSDCPASNTYSRAYLHHLFKAGEFLGPMLLTWHNLSFFQQLMAAMRKAIESGIFRDFSANFEQRYTGTSN